MRKLLLLSLVLCSLAESAQSASTSTRLRIPVRTLAASQHPLNCTSAPTYGQVEATFDNAIVNR
ncbi:MAG TPA: hypothetical protein VGG62_15600 [Terracidiphilus sp.]|jgi:hypothetical protein